MDCKITKNEEEMDVESLEEGECPKSPNPSDSDSISALDYTQPSETQNIDDSIDIPNIVNDYEIPTIHFHEINSEVKLLGYLRITILEDQIFASVDGISGLSPLDEDSVLLIDHRTPLGTIKELIGPVESPCYLVNMCEGSLTLVKDGSLPSGREIFFVPSDGRLTNFVFDVDGLKETQGSDASWIGNTEPPPECLDYSDDEKERYGRFEAAKMKRGMTKEDARRLYDERNKNSQRKRRRQPNHPVVWPPPYPMMNRYQKFPPNNYRHPFYPHNYYSGYYPPYK